MKNFYTKLFYVLLLCAVVPSFVYAYQFTQNLKQGDSNADVMELQKILNSDSLTAVATIGSGSKGNETNYFGNLTRQAVIRFQEKYRSEILTPNGLSAGTGFVGVSTRVKLSALSSVPATTTVVKPSNNVVIPPKTQQNSAFNEVNPSEKKTMSSFFGGILNKINEQSVSSMSSILDKDTLSLFPSFSKEVKVFNIEPYQAKPGQKIVVNGTGFAQNGNIFSFGSSKTESLSCAYATYCEVSIPSGVSMGEQSVSLENSNGNSSKQTFSAKVFVTNSPVMPAKIISSSPNAINESKINENIILNGERFASGGNYVFTPLGEVGPYNSSDGKTIVFSLKGLKNLDKLIERARLLKAQNVPMPIRVSNQYGIGEVFNINLIINLK
jgi:peptidoglycan hydrolase-like protein with peptidoglycan-binding domain